MKEEYLRSLIEKYANDKCNDKEKFLVEEYFKNCQENDISLLENHTAIGNRIYSKIKKQIQKKERIFLLQKQRKNFFKIAATILILIGCGTAIKLMTQKNIHTEITAMGEKKLISLPDGSTVSLNSGSTLSYVSNFNKKNRKVTLTGEAYFKVTHNKEKPFIVQTTHFSTKVLGTSFNINAYNENSKAKVSVTTGKVNVYNSENMNEFLIKNEQLAYNHINKKYTKEYHNSINDIAWKDNIILLDNTDLQTTAKILEKWFNISITIEDESLKSEHINGKFKDPVLKDVLESLRFSMDIEIEHINNQIIIKKKNPS